jgi:hypothetical protein
MDPVVAAFGTALVGAALVGAIATDAREQVREALSGLWYRVHPQQNAGSIGTELDGLRGQALRAGRDGDTGTVKALEGPGSSNCRNCREPARPWPASCSASWMRPLPPCSPRPGRHGSEPSS